MKKRKSTILVAVADPVADVQPVIERAAGVAEALQARIVLFHAAFEASLSGGRLFDSRRLAKARGALVAERTAALEKHSADLRALGVPAEACVSWEEPPHEAIIRAALREDAQIVMAGPHLPRENEVFRLRLTDWELLRLCPRPLLLMRGFSRPRHDGVILAALDPTHAWDKPASLDATIARQAGALADALDVELHVAHSIPRSAYPLAEGGAADRKRMRERLESKLQRVLKQAGVRADGIHVLQGAVETTVPQLAGKLSAQVLVLGAVSRRGIQRFAVGDTAERLIDQCACDLFIVKPEGFRLRLGRTRREALILPNAPTPSSRRPRTSP